MNQSPNPDLRKPRWRKPCSFWRAGGYSSRHRQRAPRIRRACPPSANASWAWIGGGAICSPAVIFLTTAMQILRRGSGAFTWPAPEAREGNRFGVRQAGAAAVSAAHRIGFGADEPPRRFSTETGHHTAAHKYRRPGPTPCWARILIGGPQRTMRWLRAVEAFGTVRGRKALHKVLYFANLKQHLFKYQWYRYGTYSPIWRPRSPTACSAGRCTKAKAVATQVTT